MTDVGFNDTDPIADETYPLIGPMDTSLPEPPDHEDEVDEADQPEPERVEVP
jgi:hypothetical protein